MLCLVGFSPLRLNEVLLFYVVKLKLGAGQPPRYPPPAALWPFLDLTVSAMTEIHYTHIGYDDMANKKNHLTLERSMYATSIKQSSMP